MLFIFGTVPNYKLSHTPKNTSQSDPLDFIPGGATPAAAAASASQNSPEPDKSTTNTSNTSSSKCAYTSLLSKKESGESSTTAVTKATKATTASTSIDTDQDTKKTHNQPPQVAPPAPTTVTPTASAMNSSSSSSATTTASPLLSSSTSCSTGPHDQTHSATKHKSDLHAAETAAAKEEDEEVVGAPAAKKAKTLEELVPRVADIRAKVPQKTSYAYLAGYDGRVVLCELKKERTVIGRSRKREMVPDLDLTGLVEFIKKVSHTQCAILWDEAAKSFMVKGLSKNAFQVDDSTVNNNTELPIKNGSKIVINAFTITLVIPEGFTHPTIKNDDSSSNNNSSNN